MQNETVEQKRTQLRKGLLEFCVLLVIADERVYSSDIINRLKKANLLLVEGTLYPLLSRLHTQKLLDYEWEESESGPPRKYYKLTNFGQDILKDLKQTWQDLQNTIIKLEK